MAALIVLGVIALLGVLAVLGWTADSRDPEYSLGRVLRHRPTQHDS
jgi:hypothetical protein